MESEIQDESERMIANYTGMWVNPYPLMPYPYPSVLPDPYPRVRAYTSGGLYTCAVGGNGCETLVLN